MSSHGQYDITERSPITRRQIRALRDEAARAGDDAQVRVCERALDRVHDTGQMAAWRECERVIRDAEAAS